MSAYNFAQAWNDALLNRPEREYKPRTHLWASELGSAPVDVFLKMRGEKPTNPPNARSLRKMEAGNVWEWIVSLILYRAGILEACQQRAEHQYTGLLKVTGKIDFLCSGNPSMEYAELELEALFGKPAGEDVLETFPGVFLRAGRAIVQHLIQRRKVEAALVESIVGETAPLPRPLEIKSCSSFIFDLLESRQAANPHHRLQLFHYLKSLDLPVGEIVYICRDDCRMLEFAVHNPCTAVECQYRGTIEAMTRWLAEGVRPPLESEVVWDAEVGKFSANWKVAYSGYLTRLYGYKDQASFDEKNKPIASHWNRVLGRLAGKKKMTADNQAALLEMRKAGHDPDALAAQCGETGSEEA